MSNPPRLRSAVKKEALGLSNAKENSRKEQQRSVQSDDHLKKQKAPPVTRSEVAAEVVEDDGIYHLSDKPFFDIIFAKSHVTTPYTLYLPSSIIPKLPRATVDVVLKHSGKSWNMSYLGDSSRPKFDPKWKTFVTENHLKVDDACVFELMETSSTNLIFKVHILRDDMPMELLSLLDSRGTTSDKPIVVD